MNRIKQILSFFILVIFIPLGCTPHIPKSEYPLEIGKVFHASFDKTWNAVLEVVKLTNGIIITSDKSSGLLTYTITISAKEKKSKVYMNVYLKTSNSDENTTTVFLFPKIRTHTYLIDIDRYFYNQLKTILGG